MAIAQPAGKLLDMKTFIHFISTEEGSCGSFYLLEIVEAYSYLLSINHLVKYYLIVVCFVFETSGY